MRPGRSARLSPRSCGRPTALECGRHHGTASLGFVRYCDCDNRDCDLDCDLDNHDPTAIATATLHAMQQTQEALSKHVRRDSVPTLSPDVVHRLDILLRVRPPRRVGTRALWPQGGRLRDDVDAQQRAHAHVR
jgi:hypothetical protein